MKKTKHINTDLLKTFKPSQKRLDNWIEHYGDKKPSLRKFTQLVNITHTDKRWVLVRLLSEENKVIFAIDMAVSAAQHATVAVAYAAYDAFVDAATYAAYAVAYTATDDYDAIYAASDAASAASDAAFYSEAASVATVVAADAAYTVYATTANAPNKIREEQEQLEILIYLIESQI